LDLESFFNKNPKVAIAFSGGTDSSFLLYAAKHYGADVMAYYVHSAFQPQFELDDAKKLAQQLNADMQVIELDVLADETVSSNPSDRCYYCKNRIFGNIIKRAEADGYTVLIDGTNASDDAGDRPGMRALRELKVKSPLRDCGITKAQVRQLSKEAGLFTWDKPAYACLATRIPSGTKITADMLAKVENAENFLFELGMSDFRVRVFSGAARLQVKEKDFSFVIGNREKILNGLSKYFDTVLLDLKAR
jgi:uncharacterized protein